MEIGTLLSVGYSLVRFFCNLQPTALAEASENPQYKYNEVEVGMINAAQGEFGKEFPKEAVPPELSFKEDGADYKPIYTLPKIYAPNRIKLGSNKIAPFCKQAINLLIDTINEMNDKSVRSSVPTLLANKVCNYGHINDAFRMLCIFMLGGLVELSKANFQNITELQTARKYLRFMEALNVNLVVRDGLDSFARLGSGKKVRDILNEVIIKVENAKIQIENELKKSNISTQVQQLSNLIQSSISSYYDFYSLVISSVKEARSELDIPKFELQGDWSPNKKWLQHLALSLCLSNKFLDYTMRSPLSEVYIKNYMRFEKRLIDKNGSFDEWPALAALNKLEKVNPSGRKKGSGLYRKTGEYYQEYRVFGQRLYLMSLLRSCLYYFERLVLSQGEQILSNKEAKQLIENILKQMRSLVLSINALKQRFIDWGVEHRDKMLRSPEELLEEERAWVNNFNSIQTLPDTTEDLLKYLETFQAELFKCRTNSTASVSFDGQRIIRIVEIVNAQLNPQNPPVFAPSVTDQEDTRDGDVHIVAKKGNVPDFISAIRFWIELFHNHTKQKMFLDFWKEICYLNTSLFTNGTQLPLTTRHRLEKQQEYLLLLYGSLKSPEESQKNWASKTIESLPPLKNQQENLTCMELIETHVKYNEAQLNQHANSRVTLKKEALADKALRLILLLQGHELSLGDAEAYIKILHACCFPQCFSYSEKNSLNTKTEINKSLEAGLDTLLGETLSAWKKACFIENGQPDYYQIISEGLVRLGANPLAWLEKNKNTLRDLMDKREFINLFTFFSSQTEMFLSFMQYKAVYLGQTLTRLDQKWDPFIKAITVFSTRLQQCIQSDDASWWRMTQGFISWINKLPTLFSRDPIWASEKFLGARKERFAIWLAVLAWVYQILNQTLIDVTSDPDSTTKKHALRMKKAMDAYDKLIPEKNTLLHPFNEGYKSFQGLKDALQEIVNAIEPIANEREEYIRSRKEEMIVQSALQEVERVQKAMVSMQQKVDLAKAETITAQAEKEQATSQYNALIDRTVVSLLTEALKKVSKQAILSKEILSKEDRFKAVVGLIYSDPQYTFSLGILNEVVGWTKESFKEPFEKLLEQENQPGKEKMFDSHTNPASPPQLVAMAASPNTFFGTKQRSYSVSTGLGKMTGSTYA